MSDSAADSPADELTGREPREVALPRLVEQHGDRLYSLGLRFCGDPEAARDLVQETFLLAFRKWHQFEGRARATTWLYTIASRVCQRFHRRRGGSEPRVQSLDELLPFGEASEAVHAQGERDSLEAREEHAARLAAVERAIAGLPVAFRMPLVLKEIAGLSLQEISGALGVQLETVKTRLHRARLAVRKEIESGRPRRAAPPPRFDRQLCLDLLAAKQSALDRGQRFEFPEGLVCERCATIFASLDLAQEACREIGRGALPAALRRELLAHVGGVKARRKPLARRALPESAQSAGTSRAARAPRRTRKEQRP